MDHPLEVSPHPEDEHCLSTDGGKAQTQKKTRRRLRLSCVECTKRRQKCDRQHPCGLCTTRGVAHLCRWETVPMARPAPARPPASALREANPADQTDLIQELKLKIITLEKDLENARRGSPSLTLVSDTRIHSPKSPVTLDTLSPRGLADFPPSSPASFRQPAPKIPTFDVANSYPSPGTPGQDLGSLVYPLDVDIYSQTYTMAQLSMAHHGEFIGRGSLLCALHSIAAKHLPRFLYAKSTDAMFEPPHSGTEPFSTMPTCTTVDQLIPHVPSIVAVENLTEGFFSEVNWRYGIPEKWFRRALSQMWMDLQQVTQHRSTDGRISQVNASWLMLLFSVLASAPQSAYNAAGQHSQLRSSDDYFMCAMMARRMVEDDYLTAPPATIMVSPADGTVLACFGILLLCNYLSERGRISEAWKLASYGIRNAQAVGMQRDPEWKLWQMMSADEKVLRRRAWWGLYILDKGLSFALGRPQLIRRETCDVELPSPFNEDETRNFFNTSQAILVGLMEIISETMEKCFGVEYPNCSAFMDMDIKLEQWEESLPRVFRVDYDLRLLQECSPVDLKMVARQRWMVHSWFLSARVKLWVAATTGHNRIAPVPHINRQCMETCVSVAMQLVRFQTAAYNASLRYDFDPTAPIYPGDCWFFEGCFPLFEGSVGLITTMARYPWQEKINEAYQLVQLALQVFETVGRKETGKLGDTARRAAGVLEALREDYWPGRRMPLQLPRIKDDPEMFGSSGYPNLTKMSGLATPTSPNTMSPATQYSVSSMRDHGMGVHVREACGGSDGVYLHGQV